ncbi:hypothetical protein [Vibrio owensii]|uniref:hypothetical protein n=1 Tax=Vibrio owensii TaxID=696485 RepID=UPI003CC5BC03
MSSKVKYIASLAWLAMGCVPYLAICLSQIITASFFGVDEMPEILILSVIYGFFSIKIALDCIVFQGRKAKIRLQPKKPLQFVNSIMSTLIFSGLVGAAMFATTKYIMHEGFLSFIAHIYLPPLFFVFVVPCLLQWRRKDEYDLILSFTAILILIGFSVERKK